jgi:hypothetical protein
MFGSSIVDKLCSRLVRRDWIVRLEDGQADGVVFEGNTTAISTLMKRILVFVSDT